MQTINKSALVPYSPDQMYALVDDITAYPEFLPWCHHAEEHHRTEAQVEASLEIAHSGLHKSFTTRNELRPHDQIAMSLVKGPFKSLRGVWRFEPLGDAGCKVSLEMEFEFSSRLMGMTFGPLFNKIAGTLVDSFIERAKVVYG
ncbi:type II toxin-antitoxin system RatA family toxin [Thiohalophilus sp.]|uniref:type II toxin-antitoxin system RatA family toxin n=1 Tax=Thiohalophilus sp. TaxID=3028392 RepID=UPI002ACE4129|nr:type II toxin-antitoxin system RatA family toxin [Thiohalophilus sp.]MDZ7662552.1 type II toxin-antitoxin system RatA family toxin [Thiohalophilus sp.]